jgi:hypothetical protein
MIMTHAVAPRDEQGVHGTRVCAARGSRSLLSRAGFFAGGRHDRAHGRADDATPDGDVPGTPGRVPGSLWLYGRLPGAPTAPTWLGTAHRTSGARAFLISLPVAFFCLYGFGFAQVPWTARILVHSRRIPGWALPVVGGLLLTTVVLLWFTGSWWFFGVEGVHG